MGKLSIKDNFIRSKLQVLSDFGIKITPEIKERIETLYPNEIMVENYTRKLILQKLEKIGS